MKKYFIICLLLMPVSSWADRFTDVQLDVISNDNISYGNHAPDRLGDTSVIVSALMGKPVAMGNGTLTYAAAIDSTLYQTYSNLNNTRFIASVSYKNKIGLGHVPWYTLGAKLGYKYSVDNLRDGYFAGINLGLGKRFGEDLSLHAAYVYDIENAAHEVFDGSRYSVNINGDYLLSEDLLLLASYTYMKGDIVANMLPNGHIIADSNNTFVLDPAFGAGRSSYRLSGETIHITTIGGNYFLTEGSAVEAKLEHRRGDQTTSIWSHYQGTMYAVSYIMNF